MATAGAPVVRTAPTLEPIAIIGMGCLYPRSADLSEYWANIKGRVDAIVDIPESHWRIADYYDPNPARPDHTVGRRGGFIPTLDFDPTAFGLAPNTLEATDASQLLSLIVAQEALSDAGYGAKRDFDRDQVSVILGVTGTLQLVIPLGARLGHPIWRKALREAGVADDIAEDVVARIADGYVPWQENSFPGLLGNVVAGRVANRLNLGGTNCVCDAACASSFSAIHLATMELATRRSRMVISGGVDTFNDIFMYMCFSKTPALSPTQNARPFSTDADGTILGEGIGMVVLKRLSDAEADGDRIYAVIRGVGTASDGLGKAIYAPAASGQMKALRRAYDQAGISPADVGLVEAHGTGTKVGDAIEIEAIRQVYSEHRTVEGPWCAIGSVKSQIGHTKAAAGAAGLIKVINALYHKVLPPTIKAEQPATTIAGGDTPFYVNDQARPWCAVDQPRRAAVSSFGFGGSNFHVVVEEYRPAKAVPDWDGRAEIIAMAGPDPAALRQRVQQLTDGLGPRQFARFARRAALSRRDFANDLAPAGALAVGGPAAWRLLAVVDREQPNLEQLATRLLTALDRAAGTADGGMTATPDGIFIGHGEPIGDLGFMFPGQGAQYVGMLRDLACGFPEVFDSLQEADRQLAGRLPLRAGLAETAPGQPDRPRADAATPLSDAIFPRAAYGTTGLAAAEDHLRQTQVAQPALGALELGATRVLERFGIVPAGAVGHSFGELVALAAAGAFSAEDLPLLAFKRGELMAAGEGDRGGMLAVQATADDLGALVRDQQLDVVLANRNAPRQVVLSGATAEIDRAEAAVRERGWRATRLAVAAAFHSPLVADAAEPFAKALRKVAWHTFRFPVYANTTAQTYPETVAAARDLLANQLANPVDFVGAIEAMYTAGIRTFVEVGPGARLSGMVKAILEGRPHQVVALDGSNGQRTGLLDLARTLAWLAAAGRPVTLTEWQNGEQRLEREPEERQPRLAVPVNGANLRTSKPPARPIRPPGSVALQDERQLPRAIAATTTPMTPVPPAPSIPMPATATTVGRTPDSPVMPEAPARTDTAPPDVPTAWAPVTPMAPPIAGPAEARPQPSTAATAAVAAVPAPPTPTDAGWAFTQAGLTALMQMQAQTADLHRRFLENQEQAHLALRQLIARQPAATGVAPSAVAHDGRLCPVAATRAARSDSFAPPNGAVTNDHQPMAITGSQTDTVDTGPRTVAVPPALTALRTPANLQTLAAIPAPTAPTATATPAASGGRRTPLVARTTADGALTDRERAPNRQDTATDSAATGISTVAEAGAATPPQASPGNTAGGIDPQRVRATVLAVVAEKTGYPAEMIDPEMDLEADLGIDSIKRVEIMSGVQEHLPEAPVVQPAQLGTLRTLAQVIGFLCGPGSIAPATVATTVAVPPAVSGGAPESPRLAAPPGPAGMAGETAALDPQRIRATVLAVVAEKTGYPAEMIDPEMDLEADLGIDSIKRVEIMSGVQELLPEAPVVQPAQLGTLRTLGQVIGFLCGPGQAAPAAVVPTGATTPPVVTGGAAARPSGAASPAADRTGETASALDPRRVRATVLAVVAEKTGYPAEMIDPEMDLEADLGIDSIKRVEIMSGVQELLPEAPVVQPAQLGTLRTLSQVIAFLTAAAPMTADGGVSAPVVPPTPPAHEPPHPGSEVPMRPTGAATPPDRAGLDRATVTAVVRTAVSEKTGYPPEMLALDMDLEADLGIDSIKRVEIMSAVQEQLPAAPVVQPAQLGTMRTLAQVIGFLTAAPEPTPAATAVTAPSPRLAPRGMLSAPASAPGGATAAPPATISRTPVPLVRHVVGTAPWRCQETANAWRPASDLPLWITDDREGLAAALAARLTAVGLRAELVSIDAGSHSRATPTALAGLIIVQPNLPAAGGGWFLDPRSATFLRQAFGLVQRVGPALRAGAGRGDALLAGVSRLDGHFGLISPVGITGDPAAGALAGLIKTAAREWPEVRARVLDLGFAPPPTGNGRLTPAGPTVPPPWAALADRVISLLLARGPIELGLGRDNVCYRITETPVPLPPVGVIQPAQSGLAPGAVVVVSGGARGVTAATALALAEAVKPTLLLLGRSPLPDPEPDWLQPLSDEAAIKRARLSHAGRPLTPRQLGDEYRRVMAEREIRHNLQAMNATGARVLYRPVDIRERETVLDLFDEVRHLEGPIAGIIHGAGVLRDRLIEQKTIDQFDDVFDTKVMGLRNLLEAAAPDPLAFLVLFSSVTARYGRSGQVDYAMANEALNKIAQVEAARRPATRVVAINWGPWHGGMVDDSLARIFAAEGIGLIPLADGAAHLLAEIVATDRAVEVVVGVGAMAPADSDGEPSTGPDFGASDHQKTPALANGTRSATTEVQVHTEPPRKATRTATPGEAPPRTTTEAGDDDRAAAASGPGRGRQRLLTAFERQLDLDTHPFLAAHVINGEPVFPVAMMVEWLAHGALHENPGFSFHGIDDLRVQHGLKLEGGRPIAVQVVAGKAPIGDDLPTVAVELRSGRTVHARAEVVLAHRDLPAPPRPALAVDASRPYARPVDVAYHDLLFHGPLLHGIRAIEGWSSAGIVGRLATRPAAGSWFTQPLRSGWLADPLALDAAFQLSILWTHAEFGELSLPSYLARFRQYRASWPVNEVRVVIAQRRSGPRTAAADLEFLDGAGRLVARIDGYESVMAPSLVEAFQRRSVRWAAQAE